MKFTLDFNLETQEERLSLIKTFNLNSLTKTELELCTNYVLYGKDKDNSSMVDRKEIYIKPKFSSYSKQEPISFDALLETPGFSEEIIVEKNIYKKVKPTINKEKAKNINGMKELWEEIDKVQRIVDENKGKIPKTEGTPTLDSKQLYILTHQLIDLKKQQYILMDSSFPIITTNVNRGKFHSNICDQQMNYEILPRGTMREENDIEFMMPRLDTAQSKAVLDKDLENLKKSGKPYIDFRNKEHIYQIIVNYWDIKVEIEKVPDSPLNNLLWTLDFYIDKANFNEQQLLIIRDKKLRLSNKEIAENLKKELNISHQENYISTIWNKITQQIADAATLNYDEWLMKGCAAAWKTCNCCGRELLRDSRNFVRKSKSPDGLTNRCKICDKIKRGVKLE